MIASTPRLYIAQTDSEKYDVFIWFNKEYNASIFLGSS